MDRIGQRAAKPGMLSEFGGYRFTGSFLRPAVLLSLLVLAGAALVAAVAVVAVTNLNRVSIDKEIHVVDSTLESILEDLGHQAEDYGWWDASIENLLKRFDQSWATYNIAVFPFKTFKVDAAYVFDSDSRLIYAAKRGEPARLDQAVLPENGLDRLLDQARRSPFDPVKAALGLLTIEGRPYLAAAAPLSPEIPPDPPGDGMARGVLVMMRALEGAVTETIGNRLMLEAMTYVDDAAQDTASRFPLAAVDGGLLGALVWHGERPGTDLLVWLGPTLSAAALMIGLMARRFAVSWRSEQRRADLAEGHLAAVLEGAADAIMTFDGKGAVTGVNRVAESLFGYDSKKEELPGLGDLLHDEDTGARVTLAALTATNREHSLTAICRDGYLVPVGVRVGQVQVDGESFYTAVIRDNAARKDLERSLYTAKKAAESMMQARNQFVANVTHELRTPLNAVLGFSEMIRGEALGPIGNPLYSAYANDIYESAELLLKIINDILDISLVETTEADLAERPVSLASITTSCLRLARERAERNNILLADDVGDDLPAVIADERMVKQMLTNVIANAVKFTPFGGRVHIFAESRDDGSLALVVEDNGIGVPAEMIDRVFEPYFQADSSFTRSHEGMGLGLALTKALIERHQGSCELESVQGKGTTVRIVFPRSRVIA